MLQSYNNQMQQRDKLHSRFLNYLKDPSAQQQCFATRKQVRFLLTFLGELFIKGYRIQQFGSQATIILGLNDFNNQIIPYSSIQASKKFGRSYEYLPKFVIVALQKDNNYISKHPEERLYLYKRFKRIHEFLQDPTEIYIIYLQTSKFSKLLPEQLQNTSAPDVRSYFEKKKFRLQKSMFSRLDRLEEGDKMHKVIQIFIKGCGRCCNLKYMEKQVIGTYQFRYYPEYTINTIYYVVAKQMIEGKYVTISSQKWMRKTTKKQFRRYDLILRNQDSACVLDWKFSTNVAEVLLNSRKMERKNKEYYELARKQYKTEVKLKYIVLTPQVDESYHKYKVAQYTYQTQQVPLEDSQIEDDDSCIIQYDPNTNKSAQIKKKSTEMQIQYPKEKKNPMQQIKKLQKQIKQKQYKAKQIVNNVNIKTSNNLQTGNPKNEQKMQIQNIDPLQRQKECNDKNEQDNQSGTIRPGNQKSITITEKFSHQRAQQFRQTHVNQQSRQILLQKIQKYAIIEGSKQQSIEQKKNDQNNLCQIQEYNSKNNKSAKDTMSQVEQKCQKQTQNDLKTLLMKSRQQTRQLVRQACQDYIKSNQKIVKQNTSNNEKQQNKYINLAGQIEVNEGRKKQYYDKCQIKKRQQSVFKQCIDLEDESEEESSQMDFDMCMNYKKEHLKGKQSGKAQLKPQVLNLRQSLESQKMQVFIQLSDDQD